MGAERDVNLHDAMLGPTSSHPAVPAQSARRGRSSPEIRILASAAGLFEQQSASAQ